MRGRLAKSCLVLATTLLFPVYSTASVELSIDAVSVNEGGGSFVVRATSDNSVLIGAYSVALQFHDFSDSLGVVNYDVMNLVEELEELSELFGTTPHPADLSNGDSVGYVALGAKELQGPVDLMKVNFAIDAFNDDDAFSVSILQSDIGDFQVSGSAGVRISGPLTLPMLPCDLDESGVCDVNDIDLLSQQVRSGTNPVGFDLNSDSLVNNEDRTVWIRDLMNTYVGDADLDGEFDSGDFVVVFSANQYEDGIAGNSTWGTGDWNGDGEFDSGDFVAAFTEGGYEQGPRPNVVPEPASYSIAIACVLLALRRAKNFEQQK